MYTHILQNECDKTCDYQLNMISNQYLGACDL